MATGERKVKEKEKKQVFDMKEFTLFLESKNH